MSVKRSKLDDDFQTNAFQITTEEGVVQALKTDTAEEKSEWMNAITHSSGSSKSLAAAAAEARATPVSTAHGKDHRKTASPPHEHVAPKAAVPMARTDVPDPWTPAIAAEHRRQAPLHDKARKTHTAGVARFPVPDDKVPFSVPFEDYDPVAFVAKVVKDQPVWADWPDRLETYQFNQMDTICKVNRKSHEGEYQLDTRTKMPLNPRGRTGMVERGLLGRYGPNHAADPVVTRWMRDSNKQILMNPVTGEPRIEFVAIQRVDNSEWAIPGGMVDPGEDISLTLKREFAEEAASAHGVSAEDYKFMSHAIKKLFSDGGVRLYAGYVDDPRNTDNSWMETVVVLFHDNDNSTVSRFALNSGTDAKAAQWAEITPDIKLYASHRDFVLKAKAYLLSKYIF